MAKSVRNNGGEMESIEKRDKKVTESTQELFRKVTENITKSNDKLMEDIKALVVSELRKVRKEIGELKAEAKNTENVSEIDIKLQGLQREVKNLKEDKD